LKDSAGVLHLKKLSAAGLTHVHLLPSFHFGDVDDDKTKWKSVGTIQLTSSSKNYSDHVIFLMCISIAVD